MLIIQPLQILQPCLSIISVSMHGHIIMISCYRTFTCYPLIHTCLHIGCPREKNKFGPAMQRLNDKNSFLLTLTKFTSHITLSYVLVLVYCCSFYYGSHYSSMGIVLYYLLRLEPFTSLHRNLQVSCHMIYYKHKLIFLMFNFNWHDKIAKLMQMWISTFSLT